MDWRGVSPIIATVALILILLATAGILVELLSSPTPTLFRGQFRLEDVESGKDVVVIKHIYGERAPSVLRSDGRKIEWVNLQLRLNGEVVPLSDTDNHVVYFVSEGVQVIPGARFVGLRSMEKGDVLKVQLPRALTHGDRVSLHWVLNDQTLCDEVV